MENVGKTKEGFIIPSLSGNYLVVYAFLALFLLYLVFLPLFTEMAMFLLVTWFCFFYSTVFKKKYFALLNLSTMWFLTTHFIFWVHHNLTFLIVGQQNHLWFFFLTNVNAPQHLILCSCLWWFSLDAGWFTINRRKATDHQAYDTYYC